MPTDQQQQTPPPAAPLPGGAPQGDQQQQQQQQAVPPTPTPPPASWDAVLETLQPEAKTLYELHTTGLKNALQAERTQRSELAKQLATLTKQAQAGSELEKSLQAVTGQLETATRRADFFEQAVKKEIGCRNPGLAFIAAEKDGAIDQKGRIDWTTLKSVYPELFQQNVPAVSAGSGTQNPPPPQADMNTFIRRAAGR